MTKKHSKQAGFGLLEVALASGVLIVVLTSAVALTRMAIRESVLSLSRVQAYNLAQQGVETIRQERDTAWIDNEITTNFQNIPSLQIGCKTESAITLNNKSYIRQTCVENPPQTVKNNLSALILADEMLKKISVNVSWIEYGNNWNVSVMSYLSDWKPGF